MKVTHDSPDKLILDHVPWALGGIFAALILASSALGLFFTARGDSTGMWLGLGGAAFGAVFFLVFVRRVQLVLDRPAGTATLRRRDAIRHTEQRFHLADLRGAEVQKTISTSSGSNRSTEVYRAALLVAGEPQPVPMTLVYNSGPGAQRAADAVNGWLDKAKASA